MIDAVEYVTDSTSSPLKDVEGNWLHPFTISWILWLKQAFWKSGETKGTCGKNFDFKLNHLKERIKLP